MNIASICQREPVTIDAARSLHDAAALMRAEHVGCLVVTAHGEDGAAVVGVVTDRDLAVEALARGRDGQQVRVAAMLDGRLVTIPGDASLSDAVAEMAAEGVRRLLVTGEDGELVGVASIDDVLEAWAADMVRLAQALRLAGEHEARTDVPTEPGPERLRVPDAAMLAAWQGAARPA